MTKPCRQKLIGYCLGHRSFKIEMADIKTEIVFNVDTIILKGEIDVCNNCKTKSRKNNYLKVSLHLFC